MRCAMRGCPASVAVPATQAFWRHWFPVSCRPRGCQRCCRARHEDVRGRGCFAASPPPRVWLFLAHCVCAHSPAVAPTAAAVRPQEVATAHRARPGGGDDGRGTRRRPPPLRRPPAQPRQPPSGRDPRRRASSALGCSPFRRGTSHAGAPMLSSPATIYIAIRQVFFRIWGQMHLDVLHPSVTVVRLLHFSLCGVHAAKNTEPWPPPSVAPSWAGGTRSG